jgi:small nuclear ribonucleoprotein (snRNP)-like protein
MVNSRAGKKNMIDHDSAFKQVELKTGESYRGELAEAEDNWNCQLKNVRATARVSIVISRTYLQASITHSPILSRQRPEPPRSEYTTQPFE